MKSFYGFYLKRVDYKNKVMFLAEAVILIMLNVIQVFMPICQKNIIDDLKNQIDMGPDIALLIAICLAGVFLGILSVAFQCILIMFFERKLQTEMIISSYSHTNSIIKTRGAGAYLSAVFGDSEHIAQVLSNNIFSVISQALASVVILIYSLRWSKTFFAIIVCAFALLMISNLISSKIYASRFEKGRAKVMEINPKALEIIENRSSILGFGSIHEISKKMDKEFRNRDAFFLGASMARGLGAAFDSAVKTCAIAAFFITSMTEIQKGVLEMSSFVALLSCFSYIFLPIGTLKEYFMGVRKFSMMEKRISDGLLKKYDREIPENDSLSIKDCSFAYSEGDDKLLSNISLSVNKRIGLVGLSGEGKSTIVKMIMGEIEPTEGECTLGRKKTTSLYRNIIYSLIRYYKQDAELFDEDLLFNVTLGKKPLLREKYQEKIAECFDCLKKATKTDGGDECLSVKAKSIIESLFFPGGEKMYYNEDFDLFGDSVTMCSDTELQILANIYVSKEYYILDKYEEIITDLGIEKLAGRKFGQRGNMISGGEKNRIMMARFLLPEYGKVFVIDEPFTSLDAISEQECRRVMDKFTQGMSGVVISHKLDLIREFCDEIMVIDNGMLTEKGTHEELMSIQGLYCKLFNARQKLSSES